MTFLYDLTEEELTDSPLARLAVERGYSSLNSLCNEWSCWGMTVERLTALLTD
jgi:hypothetical protein